MADQFPLVADGTAIKELPSGDNLDLTGSNIVGAGTVALTNLTVSGSQGTAAQVLQSTGSGIQWGTLSAGGITDVVNDTSPQLGGTLDANSNNIDMGTNVLTDTNLGNFITAYGWGNHASAGYLTSTLADTSPQLGGALDVNGQDIVSTSNGAIDLDPHGSGVVVFKGNATKGAGQFKLNCENNSHGVIIKGPPHSASANYTLTLPTTDGNADQQLKTDGSGNLSWVDAAAGGGGAWTVISSTTVSSAVSAVEITLTGSYTRYAINWQGVNFGSTESFVCFQFKEGTDSSFHSVMYLRNGYGTNTGSFTVNQGSTTSSNTVYPQTNALVNSSQGSCSGVMEIHNVLGMPAAYGYAMTNQTGSKLGYTNFVVKLNGAQSGDKFGAVSFAPASGNVEAGTFTLYGLALS